MNLACIKMKNKLIFKNYHLAVNGTRATWKQLRCCWRSNQVWNIV